MHKQRERERIMERVESDGKREEENRGRDKGLAKKREKQMK